MEELSTSRQSVDEAINAYHERIEALQNSLINLCSLAESSECSGRIATVKEIALQRFVLYSIPSISSALRRSKPNSLTEALNEATLEEKYLSLQCDFSSTSLASDSYPSLHTPPNSHHNVPPTFSNFKQCKYCKKFGHVIEECQKRQAAQSKKSAVQAQPSNSTEPRVLSVDCLQYNCNLNNCYTIQFTHPDKVGNLINFEFLVDTGASISVIKTGKIKNTNLFYQESKPVKINGISRNAPISTVGTIVLDTSYKKYKLPLKFHIIKGVNNIPFDGIIGNDFLHKHGAILDLNKLNLTLFDFPINLKICRKLHKKFNTFTIIPLSNQNSSNNDSNFHYPDLNLPSTHNTSFTKAKDLTKINKKNDQNKNFMPKPDKNNHKVNSITHLSEHARQNRNSIKDVGAVYNQPFSVPDINDADNDKPAFKLLTTSDTQIFKVLPINEIERSKTVEHWTLLNKPKAQFTNSVLNSTLHQSIFAPTKLTAKLNKFISWLHVDFYINKRTQFKYEYYNFIKFSTLHYNNLFNKLMNISENFIQFSLYHFYLILKLPYLLVKYKMYQYNKLNFVDTCFIISSRYIRNVNWSKPLTNSVPHKFTVESRNLQQFPFNNSVKATIRPLEALENNWKFSHTSYFSILDIALLLYSTELRSDVLHPNIYRKILPSQWSQLKTPFNNMYTQTLCGNRTIFLYLHIPISVIKIVCDF